MQVVGVSIADFSQYLSLEVVIVSIYFVNGLPSVLAQHLRVIFKDIIRVVFDALSGWIGTIEWT